MNNQQHKKKDGTIGRGIEWTDFSWNPIGGCMHGCRWTMPDGTEALCYAEVVAERVAQAAFPKGFAHHYYRPLKMTEPLNQKKPSRIFLDSMSDLMGAWVPDEQVFEVLEVVKRAHWHQFQLLTKNAPRLLHFEAHLPSNLWVGVSAPPSKMHGQGLTLDQQQRMVKKQLEVFNRLRYHADLTGFERVLWMSIEPLSFDIAPLLEGAGLDWAVIGAASNGKQTYQPEKAWVDNLIAVLRRQNAAIFFKGNLERNFRLEEFPTVARVG